MIILDLFSGLKGWSEPWINLTTHTVVTFDNNPKFNADYTQDIQILNPLELFPNGVDVILASPPCQKFSVLNIGKYWNTDHTPKTTEAAEAVKLVELVLNWVDKLSPKFWIMENPRAKLRRLPVVSNLERRTVTWCQYGSDRMKPTDLWGVFPPSLKLKPICSNGMPCHVAAPRGSQTGTQGTASDIAGKIPYPLALDVMEAILKDM